LQKRQHHEQQSGPLHAGRAKGEQRQGDTHVACIHEQRWERKTAGSETKKEKIEADEQANCGKNY
jgi:hypothetical protein